MSSDKFYVLFEFVNENQSDEDTGSTPCEVGWSQWIQFEGERKSIQELIDNKIQVLTKWPSSCNVASKEVVKKRKGDIQFTEAVATVLAQSDDWVEIVEMSRTFRTYGKVVVDKAERKKIVMINAGSNDPAQVPLGKRKSGENAESKKEVMQAKAATEKKMVSTIVKDTGSRLIGKMSYTELQTSDDEGSSALVGPRKKNVPGNLKRKAKEFNFYDSSDSEDEVLSKMTRHDLQMKVRILQSDKKKLEEKLMVAKSPNSSIGDTYILSQEISHFKSLLKEQLTSFIELKDEVKRLGFELKEELREFSHRLRDELKGRLVEDLKRELKAEFNELWQQKEQPAVQVIQSESYQTLSPSLTCDAGRVFGSSSAVLDLTEIDFKNIVVENGTSEVANIPVTPCVPLTSCPRSPKINFENSGIEEGINAVRETPASPSVSSVCSSNSSKPCNGMRMVNYSEPHPKRLKQTPSRKKVLRPAPVFDPAATFDFGPIKLSGAQLMKCNHSGKLSFLAIDIFTLLFSDEEMASSSLSGRSAYGHKNALPKRKLDPERVEAIIEYIAKFMEKEMKKEEVEVEVKKAIQNKLNNFTKSSEAKLIQQRVFTNSQESCNPSDVAPSL